MLDLLGAFVTRYHEWTRKTRVELCFVIQFFNSHGTEAAESSPARLKAWARWVYTCIFTKMVK